MRKARRLITVKQRTSALLKQNMIAYLFLLPAMGIFILFVFTPAVQTVYYSLTQWQGIGPKEFIGLKNYMTIFTTDKLFWQSVLNNLSWTVAAAIVPVWLGLIIANITVRSKIKYASIFQMIFFLPQVISTVIAAVIWKWIYDPAIGPLNNVLNAMGLGKFAIGWLGEPKIVLWALFVIYVWQTFGFCMVLFTSAIQGVDEQLYEASRIDGCGGWGQFWNVTFPGIRQAMTSTLLLVILWSFQVFDLVVTTTEGGPGYSSYVFSYYIYYQGLIARRIGYAAAASVILTVLSLAFTKLFMYFRERE